MAGKVRLTTDEVPVIWLVSPRGKPFKHPVGLCFNSKVIRYDNGVPTLRPGAIERGFRYLRDVLEPDEIALWLEYAKAEAKAKGKLRLPQHLRPRALQTRDTAHPRARDFVPSAELAMTKKRVSIETPAEASAGDQVAIRDAQIEELLAASKAMAAELAMLREDKALSEQLAAELATSAEIEAQTIAPKAEDPKPSDAKPEKKPKAEKGDAI